MSWSDRAFPHFSLQPAPPGRSRERFISLPDELQVDDAGKQAPAGVHPTIFEVRTQDVKRLSARWYCRSCLMGQRHFLTQPGFPLDAQDLPEETGRAGLRGRITIYCVAESLDRKALELRLRERGGTALLHTFPDVLYGQYTVYEVRRRARDACCV